MFFIALKLTSHLTVFNDGLDSSPVEWLEDGEVEKKVLAEMAVSEWETRPEEWPFEGSWSFHRPGGVESAWVGVPSDRRAGLEPGLRSGVGVSMEDIPNW